MKQENGQANKEGSDIEMDDLEKSLEDAHDDVSRASISKRLVKWRVTKLYSMPQPARSVGHSASQDSASHDFALKVLQEMLTADRGAYKRLRRFMERLKKTEEGRWYCVRAIGIDPGSFRDAERLPITAWREKPNATRVSELASSCSPLAAARDRRSFSMPLLTSVGRSKYFGKLQPTAPMSFNPEEPSLPKEQVERCTML